MGDFLDNLFGGLADHWKNAGTYETKNHQRVSGNDLPPDVHKMVNAMAYLRDNSTEASPHIQEFINHLYNPDTRDRAMSLYNQTDISNTPGYNVKLVNQALKSPQ